MPVSVRHRLSGLINIIFRTDSFVTATTVVEVHIVSFIYSRYTAFVLFYHSWFPPSCFFPRLDFALVPRHMKRRPPHPSRSPFPEGRSNAQAVAQLPESPPTQGDIQWDRSSSCDPVGSLYTFCPTIAGPVGPRHSLSMSGNGGWNVLDQLQQQSRGPYALSDPTSPLPIPETLGDALPTFVHQTHQFSPLGASAPWMIAHPPAPYIPIPMDTYNPVCDTSCPIGLGGSQMHWGDFPASPTQIQSPSDQNNQRSYPSHTPHDHTVQKPCGWRCQDGTLCGAAVTYHCQDHLATAHRITKLSGKTFVWCKWCYPDHQIKRECILRHIREVHLGVSRSMKEHTY